MATIEALQARTTYVLQAIERSLGQFAISRRECSAIISDEGGEQSPASAFRDRVAESYLGDLFGLALDVTRGTSSHTELLHLKALAESLGIYEIRNACAHPNRTFFPHYWYRIASLAQDPAFALLGIEEVRTALANAESDSFATASSEWTVALKNAVENNLPSPFEHDRTGLIGRGKLEDDLINLLLKGRFPTIALVGPGGLGKTALALEVLKRVAYSSHPGRVMQFVVFVSLKTQRLTSAGVEIFDALPTLEDLERKLVEALRETVTEDMDLDLGGLMRNYENSQILICIDNLENVLMASAGDFEEFLGKLPAAWRLLITTRIPINSAHCISVNALQPVVAGNLAMGYSRSVGLQLSRDSADEIARVCKNNPLAIKITVDAVSSGVSIEHALASATSETLRFSYDLLLETLSADCLQVLEVLFATGSINRSDAALILEADSATVAEALGVLARTSLVFSQIESGSEKYSLNDSVRELLRVHPANLELRSTISGKIAKRRQHADHLVQQSERRGESEYSEYYVPSENPMVLREISRLLQKGKADDLASALVKLNIVEPDCRSIDTYWLLKGVALAKCRDPQAEGALQQAIDISQSLRARYYLANWLFVNKRYVDSSAVYLGIKESGGCDAGSVGEYFADKVVRGLLMSSVYAGHYQRVLDLTKEFAVTRQGGDVLFASRISAARMLFHLNRDISDLRECIEVFELGAKNVGYTTALSKEGMHLIADLCFDAHANRLHSDAAILAAGFALDHYERILPFVPRHVLQEEHWVASKLLTLVESLDSDLPQRVAIYKLVGIGGDGGSRPLISIPVRICEFNYPPDRQFRFAVCRNGQRHYLRVEDFNGGGPEWRRLLPGTQIYIVPGDSPAAEGGAPRAKEISLVPVFDE